MGTRLNGSRFWTLSGLQYTITLQIDISDVQKPNCLRAQLHDGAERVIAGLPLTSAN